MVFEGRGHIGALKRLRSWPGGITGQQEAGFGVLLWPGVCSRPERGTQRGERASRVRPLIAWRNGCDERIMARTSYSEPCVAGPARFLFETLAENWNSPALRASEGLSRSTLARPA